MSTTQVASPGQGQEEDYAKNALSCPLGIQCSGFAVKACPIVAFIDLTVQRAQNLTVSNSFQPLGACGRAWDGSWVQGLGLRMYASG